MTLSLYLEQCLKLHNTISVWLQLLVLYSTYKPDAYKSYKVKTHCSLCDCVHFRWCSSLCPLRYCPVLLAFPPRAPSAYSGDWLCSRALVGAEYTAPSPYLWLWVRCQLAPSTYSSYSDLSLFAWMLLLRRFADLKHPFMHFVYIIHCEGLFPGWLVPYNLLFLWWKVTWEPGWGVKHSKKMQQCIKLMQQCRLLGVFIHCTTLKTDTFRHAANTNIWC